MRLERKVITIVYMGLFLNSPLACSNDAKYDVLDPYIESCITIWTKLDLVRAIKPSESDCTSCIENVTESFLLLYQPLVAGLAKNKTSLKPDSIDCLRETCSAIGCYLEDVYSHKAHESFICTKVVIAKIIQQLSPSIPPLSKEIV